MKKNQNSPLSLVREAAGLSLLEAARSVGIAPEYLQRIERRGQAPYVLAEKLARRYRCSAMIFAQRLIVGSPSSRKGGIAKAEKRMRLTEVGGKRQSPPLQKTRVQEGF
jgi:hypothetical protein